MGNCLLSHGGSFTARILRTFNASDTYLTYYTYHTHHSYHAHDTHCTNHTNYTIRSCDAEVRWQRGDVPVRRYPAVR